MSPHRHAIRASGPTFYSVALLSVETSPMKKGIAGQEFNRLKQGQNVKRRISKIGVKDWINAQAGAVTREGLADYIRARRTNPGDSTERGGRKQ